MHTLCLVQVSNVMNTSFLSFLLYNILTSISVHHHIGIGINFHIGIILTQIVHVHHLCKKIHSPLCKNDKQVIIEKKNCNYCIYINLVYIEAPIAISFSNVKQSKCIDYIRIVYSNYC